MGVVMDRGYGLGANITRLWVLKSPLCFLWFFFSESHEELRQATFNARHGNDARSLDVVD